MLKKILLLLTIVLFAPNLASAYNYWYVDFSTSPAGFTSSIVPPSGADYVTSGTRTNIVSATVTSADFRVNAPPGYALSYVTIDSVRTNPISGNIYRVNKGSVIGHRLVAYYINQTYTITTSKTGNGVIDPTATVAAGSTKVISMTAATGWVISSVNPGGATLTGGDGVNTASYTFTNIQSDKSISVVFAQTPVVNAVISTTSQTIIRGNPLNIDGSASTSNVTPTFTWTVSPPGPTLTPSADGKSVVFNTLTTGTWTVQLTLSAPGATSSSASITVSAVTRAYFISTDCMQCHNDFTAAIDQAYLRSTHVTTDTVSCQACHNPTGTLNHYFNLLHETVSPTTFKFIDPVAGPVGQVFCANCHSQAQLAQSAAHGEVPCGSCHNNDVHNPDITGGGVNLAFCSTCHGPSAAAIPPLSAAHGATLCSGCHGNQPHNPHIANAGVNANYCGSCHGVSTNAIPPLSVAHSTQCSACHGSSEHNPHIANAGVNATYCGSCHGPSANPIPPLSAAHNLACNGCHGNSEHNPHVAGGVNATFCSTCHGVSANAIPTLSAGHSTQCAGCHGTSEHNPHTTDGIAANPCFTCHNKANQAHYFEIPTAQLDGQCGTCHSGHNHNPQPKAGVLPQHFNGYTSYANPGYAAAYVTPVTQCANCHKGGDATSTADLAIVQYRQDWAGSPHGNVRGSFYLNSAERNWKASGQAGVRVSQAGNPNDCQRCHTATGYVRFSNLSSIDPISGAEARYSEPITCNACHEADATHVDFATRSVSARTGYYNYSSQPTGRLLVSAAFPDVTTSNICIGCHTGREAGDTVRAIGAATAQNSYSAAFWRSASFVSSHSLPAGGQVFGVTGYHYPGQDYANSVNHAQVGSGAKGPCVTCHMPNKSHTRDAWSTGYAQCAPCHGSAITSSFVADKNANFQAALKALGAALSLKGHAPNLVGGVLSAPYFASGNWGDRVTGPGTMGAAFNYNLLAHDPGAFAHNPTYAKRLVRDSLDYLTNGSVNRGRDLTATINALLSTQTERSDAASFLSDSANGSSACAACHSGSLDPQTGKNIVSTYDKSRHASVAGGASCSSCHAPSGSVAHPPAMTMLKDPALIAERCYGCHNVPASHTWPSIGQCGDCHNGHDPIPSVNGYPHFSSYSTAQYVGTGFQCTNCHNAARGPFASYTGLGPFRIYPANREWAGSGHGNPRSKAYVGPGPYTEESLENYDFRKLGTPAPATAATSTGNDCVRCHTATGYLNYVTPMDPNDAGSAFLNIAPWGNSADRTRQMVGCPVCHNQTPKNQLDYNFSRRWVGVPDDGINRSGTQVVKGWFNYSSLTTKKIIKYKLFADSVGEELYDSNLCISCHSGKAVGDLIKPASNVCSSTVTSLACRVGKDANGHEDAVIGATNQAFWGNVDLVDPHGGGAANMLFPDTLHAAYEYWTGTAITPDHAGVGSGIDYATLETRTQGPCVGCHMTSGKKHSFKVLSSASNGAITGIRSSMCANCHNGYITSPLSVGNLEQTRQNYRAAVTLIKNLLTAKGFYYDADKAPYFFSTSDPAQHSLQTRITNWSYTDTVRNITWQGANLYGAAFNLRLLDSGAGWVHNPIYARKVLYDTIDYLDDGVSNFSVSVDAGNSSLQLYLTRPNF